MELNPTAFLARPLRIIVVGAGISGIQFLKDATSRLDNISVACYEKNENVGGTWHENKYPGCTCDVPSHVYQYSWNPNPVWSQFYAAASEIKVYLEKTVDKFNLRQYFRFKQRCVDANWDEAASEWTITVQAVDGYHTEQVQCDVLVYAVGRLNNPKIPDIPGLSSFSGQVLHTAAWPEDTDIEGKVVAVIGNGASALQCIPSIQKLSKKVYNLIRGPTWLVPHVFSYNDEPQQDFSQHQLQAWREDPVSYNKMRHELERQVAASFAGLWNGSSSKEFTEKAESHMRNNVKNPDVLKILLPSFPAGCRRFTPADAYIAALNECNVNVVKGSVTAIDRDGLIMDNGTKFHVDCIVCATGFDPYTPRFPVRGRDGHNLQEEWSIHGNYESYMATSVAGYPNFFVFNPPNCPVNGSAYPGIERASDYMIRVISRLQTDNLRSICVKRSSQVEFNQWVQSRMQSMVWSGSCSSWYKSEDGKVIVPWPGTILHYYKATEIIRWEDFELRFRNETNKYASFGNGITLDSFTPRKFPWLPSSS